MESIQDLHQSSEGDSPKHGGKRCHSNGCIPNALKCPLAESAQTAVQNSESRFQLEDLRSKLINWSLFAHKNGLKGWFTAHIYVVKAQ